MIGILLMIIYKYTYIYTYIYQRLTHKQNINFTYLLRFYSSISALFRFLCKFEINLKQNLEDFVNKIEDFL